MPRHEGAADRAVTLRPLAVATRLAIDTVTVTVSHVTPTDVPLIGALASRHHGQRHGDHGAGASMTSYPPLHEPVDEHHRGRRRRSHQPVGRGRLVDDSRCCTMRSQRRWPIIPAGTSIIDLDGVTVLDDSGLGVSAGRRRLGAPGRRRPRGGVRQHATARATGSNWFQPRGRRARPLRGERS